MRQLHNLPRIARWVDVSADSFRLARYQRQMVLPGFGPDAQRKLLSARVLMVGAGGLGAPALQYLAAAGVGHIHILDPDTVSESNLQRQILYRHADIGQPKAPLAAAALRQLNPDIEITAEVAWLDAAHADTLAQYDLVLDGSDNFGTRYRLNDACVRAGIPLIQGTLYQYEGEVAVWNHPVGGVNLRDLHPNPPPPDAQVNCAEAGVLGALAGLIGSQMALLAMQVLTGTGNLPAGALWRFDAWTGRSIRFQVEPDPANPLRQPSPPDLRADYEIAACDLPTGPAADRLEWTWADLAALAPNTYTLLDVRQPWEHELAHAGGLNLPLDQLPARLTELPADMVLVCYCQSGARSAAAARLLRNHGLQAHTLQGGMNSR